MYLQNVFLILILTLLDISLSSGTLDSRYLRRRNHEGRKPNRSNRNGATTNNIREQDFYSYFVQEAPKHPGNYKSDYSKESISWFDEKKLLRGQEFYERNFIGVATATFYSGIELMAIKSTTSVLMISGTVNSRLNAFTRVLRTIVHNLAISTSGLDVFRKGSPSYNSLQTIRRKHRSASYTYTNRSQDAIEYIIRNNVECLDSWKEMSDLAKAIRADLAFVDISETPKHLLNWDSTTPVGQFDLGMVQFIIFCHVAMSPKAFGIYLATPEDIQAYIHVSALVGRTIGIEDRFNVALNLPPDMYKKFYRNIVVASYKNIDENVLRVMAITMESISNNFLVPDFFRLKCWLYHSLINSVDGYQGKHILRLMNFQDRFCLTLVGVGTSPVNYSKLFGNFAKGLFRSWFNEQKIKFNITI